MKHFHSCRALFITLVAFTFIRGGDVDAQQPATPSSALELMRRSGAGDVAAKVLAQDGGIQAPDALDRLADELTRIAVEFDGDDTNIIGRKRAVNSVHALDHAGSKRATVRYEGAEPRLRAIVEQGKDKPVRSLALQSMLSVTDVASLIPYLSDLATSRDPIADHAVSMLMRYTGDGGRTELRWLYRQNKVVESNAKELLALIASANNW